MSKKNKRLLFSLCISLFLLIGSSFFPQYFEILPTASPSPITNTPGQIATSAALLYEKVVVERVVDGDTIKLSDGRTLRYIGIDTPESVDPRKPVECFAKEASAKNKELVEGKEVFLEKDISDTDRYARLLRYVYLDEQKTQMVNKMLIENGYARAASFPPDTKYQQEFSEIESASRLQQKGLWNPTTCS